MNEQEFFAQAKEQSIIKTAIVAKYFWSWAKVIIPRVKKAGGSRIAYLDLFSGPGRYEDGTKSTPLLVLERAIREPEIAQMLVSVFNDECLEHAASLREEIARIPGIDKLAIKPRVENFTVGSEIATFLTATQWPPTLLFVDPFGYKGLSIDLIHAVLKHWGCDCIFFFNYRRINMAIDNSVFQGHMAAIFGLQRLNNLKKRLGATSSPDVRELTVIEALSEALQEKDGKYVLPFRFRSDVGSRTSHHLVFVSKNVLAYTMMKDIMARESSTSTQGVASFEYNQATKNQPMLFSLTTTLEELEGMLLEEFAGRTITVEEVFRQHHVGRRFVRENYRQVLMQLEREGKVTVQDSSTRRRENTLPPNTEISFIPATKTRLVQRDLFN